MSKRCERCKHTAAKHATPGGECVHVIGHDAGGDVFCSCSWYVAPAELEHCGRCGTQGTTGPGGCIACGAQP